MAEPKGEDPPGTPRPPSSSRMLSARLDGSMYGAYVFATDAAPKDVIGFYDGALPAQNWQLLAGHTDFDVEVWQKDGVTMMVHAIHLDDDDKTRVTIAQGRTTAAAEASR